MSLAGPPQGPRADLKKTSPSPRTSGKGACDPTGSRGPKTKGSLPATYKGVPLVTGVSQRCRRDVALLNYASAGPGAGLQGGLATASQRLARPSAPTAPARAHPEPAFRKGRSGGHPCSPSGPELWSRPSHSRRSPATVTPTSVLLPPHHHGHFESQLAPPSSCRPGAPALPWGARVKVSLESFK